MRIAPQGVERFVIMLERSAERVDRERQDLFRQQFVSQSAVDTSQTLVESARAVVASSRAAV